MPTVDYEPVAVASGANVDSQANFSGSGYQLVGFSSGLAQSKQANKVWRQASMVAACIANFISQVLNINVLDDGNLTTLIANFIKALRAGAWGLFQETFSATPIFDCNNGNVFEITLTGNVTSSTLVNVPNGTVIGFIIHQDATGSRTFVWPVNANGATIDPGASNTSTQFFFVDGSGTLRPMGAMTVS